MDEVIKNGQNEKETITESEKALGLVPNDRGNQMPSKKPSTSAKKGGKTFTIK